MVGDARAERIAPPMRVGEPRPLEAAQRTEVERLIRCGPGGSGVRANPVESGRDPGQLENVRVANAAVDQGTGARHAARRVVKLGAVNVRTLPCRTSRWIGSET